MSNKAQEIIELIKDCLYSNPKGMTLEELNIETGISMVSLRKATDTMGLKCNEDGKYIDPTLTNIKEVFKNKESPIKTTENKPKQKPKRTKPYTANPMMGYMVEESKVRIFLHRRASSNTLTLSLDDLEELTEAIKKANEYF